LAQDAAYQQFCNRLKSVRDRLIDGVGGLQSTGGTGNSTVTAFQGLISVRGVELQLESRQLE
jgi:hypothetical protein